MLYNYFAIGVRNLLKDRSYTSLNVLGLTVSITFSLLLMVYVNDELSYDRFHDKAERIFRISSHVKETENEFKLTQQWTQSSVPHQQMTTENKIEKRT